MSNVVVRKLIVKCHAMSANNNFAPLREKMGIKVNWGLASLLTIHPVKFKIQAAMLFSFGFVHPWWIWVALVIVFALIEVFTLGLTTVWFAIAALVMVFLSFTNMPLTAQFLIFLAIAALLLIFTRPLAVKKFKIGREKTNVDSLVGKHALVVKTIGEFERGEAKIDGLIWSARSEDNTEITEGSKCEILRIEGVQLIVRKLTEEKL